MKIASLHCKNSSVERDFCDEGYLGWKGTCCIQLHHPHLAPSVTKLGQKLGAGPHRELVSRVNGAAAMKEDAAFVLDHQQVGLVFVTSTVDVPA